MPTATVFTVKLGKQCNPNSIYLNTNGIHNRKCQHNGYHPVYQPEELHSLSLLWELLLRADTCVYSTQKNQYQQNLPWSIEYTWSCWSPILGNNTWVCNHNQKDRVNKYLKYLAKYQSWRTPILWSEKKRINLTCVRECEWVYILNLNV